jgi:hypothetical protein
VEPSATVDTEASPAPSGSEPGGDQLFPATTEDSAATEYCWENGLDNCVPDAVDPSPLLDDVTVLAAAVRQLARDCAGGSSPCPDAQKTAEMVVELATRAADACLNDSNGVCQTTVATVASTAGIVVQLAMRCASQQEPACRAAVEAVWAAVRAAQDTISSCTGDSQSLCQQAARLALEAADAALDLAGDIAAECLNNYYGTCQSTLRLAAETAGEAVAEGQRAVQQCLNDSAGTCQTAARLAVETATAALAAAVAAADSAVDFLIACSTGDACPTPVPPLPGGPPLPPNPLGDLPAYTSSLTLEIDGVEYKDDAAWQQIQEPTAGTLVEQRKPDEGDTGSKGKPIYCNTGNYRHYDRNGQHDLRYNCPYEVSNWAFKMSPSLVEICRGGLREIGAQWWRNKVQQSSNSPHDVPWCDYQLHGTFKPTYNKDGIDWYDVIRFDCKPPPGSTRCKATLNIGGSFQPLR